MQYALGYELTLISAMQ